MKPENFKLKNKLDTKDYRLYGPIYMKFLEKATFQGQKADRQLPGAGDRNSLQIGMREHFG